MDATNTSASTGNQPEKKFSTGALSATVWQNQGKSKTTGEAVTFRSVTFQRRYKDKDGNWQSTSNLRINDLPRAALVLQKAYEYLVLRGMNGSGSEALDSAIEEVVM
ncbi:hypothetical protein KY361_07335 [Candidatus Woesearchaeota archaeon]|nr:hypothetical protein [Candidatus Woesearchaeota archaeon]